AHRNQSVVRGQSVETFVLDRTVVRNVAVDRVEIDVRRVDAIQDDAAVGRFGGKVAVDVGETDALVDGADLDAAFCLLEEDLTLNRLERHEARATADVDVAVGGLDGDVGTDPFEIRVNVSARDVDRHPLRHGQRVVERARASAAEGTRADCQHLIARLDVHGFAIRDVDLDADRVP